MTKKEQIEAAFVVSGITVVAIGIGVWSIACGIIVFGVAIIVAGICVHDARGPWEKWNQH